MALALWPYTSVCIPTQKADPFQPGCITKGSPSNEPGTINIHIVAHSHDDVGWLKTVDQYYYGANNSIQHAGVQYIFDTVVEQCAANPDRRFTIVEQAFFQRWWNEQPEPVRAKVHRLVTKGQIVFINGGWSMHDEACTHYVSMVENTALGHRFIMEQFGVAPRIGWQIDPFGHSAVQGALLSAEVGFDALYFARMDWQEEEVRVAARSMDMVWRPSPSLGADAEVFTGVFPDQSYGPPPGLCFDEAQCNGGMPVMDDECLEDGNVQGFVDLVVDTARRYANASQADPALSPVNVLFLMGSDFQYENADEWYRNLDKLIHYVNKDGRVNAFYSNPEMYTDAKYREGVTRPVKEDDFMPLANDAQSYWTGFFASRPTLKRYERVQAGYLQAGRQLQLWADLEVNKYVRRELAAGRGWYRFWFGMGRHDMDPLAAAVALNQHHDAVTGTEKQHVAYDYALRMSVGGAVADMVVEEALGQLSGAEPAGGPFVRCGLLNESACPPSHAASRAGRPFSVTVYNPLSDRRTAAVRVPVGAAGLVVTDAVTGDEIPSTVVEATPCAGPGQTLQAGAEASPLALVFLVPLRPYALRTFAIAPAAPPAPPAPAARRERADGGDEVVAENEHIRVTFSAVTGLMTGMTNKDEGVAIALENQLAWYPAEQGAETQRSGAYIFRPASGVAPDGSNAACVGQRCQATLRVVQTDVVTEVHQVFSEWAAQTVRVYKGAREAEVEWTVGPVPVGDGLGKEVVARYTTGIESAGRLWTDSNARDMLPRRRCVAGPAGEPDTACRPSVPAGYKVTEPVAGNYWPVNAQAVLADDGAALAVVVDRAQGVASLKDGQLEFMLHRRLLYDDARGVGEPLNETQSITPYDWRDSDGTVHHDPVRVGPGLVVRGKHLLSVTAPPRAARAYRRLQDEVYYEPVVAVQPDGVWKALARPGMGPTVLPPNVNIMTLEKQPEPRTVLLRLAHRFGVGEDEELSVPASVSLARLFRAAGLSPPVQVTELSLSGNQPKHHMLARRRRFPTADGPPAGASGYSVLFDEAPAGPALTVQLAPLQIRTFLVRS